MKKYLPLLIIMFAIVISIVNHLAQDTSHPPTASLGEFIFLRQPDEITCGPTSTLMLLLKYDKDITFNDVLSRTRTKWFTYKGKNVGMTSPEFIASAMNKLGVPARLKHGSLDRLRHYISVGRPPVVLLRSGVSTWHYVLAIGYDSQFVIVADPASGRREWIDNTKFLGAWRFLTDMRGRMLRGLCPLCHGTGQWIQWDLGPLSMCELCAGSGLQPDYLGMVLHNADVNPNTMIVPDQPFPDYR